MKKLIAFVICCLVLVACAASNTVVRDLLYERISKKEIFVVKGVAFRKDDEYLDGDSKSFIVKAEHSKEYLKKNAIPLDAVVYAYMRFGDLLGDEPYFDRIVKATVAGLTKTGSVSSCYLDRENIPLMMGFRFTEKERHLVVMKWKDQSYYSPTTNAIDLSEYF